MRPAQKGGRDGYGARQGNSGKWVKSSGNPIGHGPVPAGLGAVKLPKAPDPWRDRFRPVTLFLLGSDESDTNLRRSA